MEDEKVKQLANTLRKNGLAASEYEAIEKAKSILNVSIQKSGVSEEKDDSSSNQSPISAVEGMENEQMLPDLERELPNQDVDLEDESVTLNELMEELNISPEEVEAQEQARLNDIQGKIDAAREDLEQAEEHPENAEQIREEIADIRDDVDKIAEVTENENPENFQEGESQPQKNKKPENDMFKEEQKIDLTKIFGNKR